MWMRYISTFYLVSHDRGQQIPIPWNRVYISWMVPAKTAMLRIQDGRLEMEAGCREEFKRGVFRTCSVNTSPLCSDQQVKSLQTQVVGAVRPKQNVMQEVDGDVFGRVVTRP